MSLIGFSPSIELLESFPEFGKLEIIGTVVDPLFYLTDVQKMLGLERIRLDVGYIEGKHYLKRDGLTSDGKRRERVMLTEAGLYRVLGKSNSQVADKFMDFVTVVMRDLRIKGHVTLTDALKKLELRNDMLDKQLEAEHAQLVQKTAEADKWYAKYTSKWEELMVLKSQERSREKADDSYLLQCVKDKLFKPVFLYMVNPPKDVADEFENDDLDPTEDQEICFEISNKTRDVQATAEIQVLPNVSLAQIKDKLDDCGYTLMVKGNPHRSYYRGTIEQVRDLIDGFITL